VIDWFDLDSERLRYEVQRATLGLGRNEGVGPLPITLRAGRTLELAQTATVHLGEPLVNPDHLLLALLFDRDCTASRVLIACDVDPDDVRDELTRLRSAGPHPS
jgi:hypothetical protein